MSEKFNYDYFNAFMKKLVLSNNRPLQVELHPGTSCGVFNCKFCYGKKDFRPEGEKIDFSHYKKLIDDLVDKVSFIDLAGIKSDPLVTPHFYDIIKKIKENDIRLGIHTKGYYLNEKSIKLLNINTAYGDFITFSVDSSNDEFYKKIHGIKAEGNFFDTTAQNIQNLYSRKIETGSNLNVNVAYLLFEENSNYTDIKAFIEKFKDYSDTLKFSFPQVPNLYDEEPEYYVQNKEKVREDIQKLQNEYSDYNVVFLEFETNTHSTDFTYCIAQRFLSVIDSCGNIYPCPQVASEKYNYLSYGNLHNDDYWTIWNSKNRKRILEAPVKTMSCRICDRKDEELNMRLRNVLD